MKIQLLVCIFECYKIDTVAYCGHTSLGTVTNQWRFDQLVDILLPTNEDKTTDPKDVCPQ
jgi:hypothetical protein